MRPYLKPLHDAVRALQGARTVEEHEALRRGLRETAFLIREQIQRQIEIAQFERERILIQNAPPTTFVVAAIASVAAGLRPELARPLYFSSIGVQAIMAMGIALGVYGAMTALVALTPRVFARQLAVFVTLIFAVAMIGLFSISRIQTTAFAGISPLVLLVNASCLSGALLFAAETARRGKSIDKLLQALWQDLVEVEAIVNVASSLEFTAPHYYDFGDELGARKGRRGTRDLAREHAEIVEVAGLVGLCEVQLSVAEGYLAEERQVSRGMLAATVVAVGLTTGMMLSPIALKILVMPFLATGCAALGLLVLRATAIYHRDTRQIAGISRTISGMQQHVADAERQFRQDGNAIATKPNAEPARSPMISILEARPSDA